MTHRAVPRISIKLLMVLETLIDGLKGLFAAFPDERTGENTVYHMADVGIAVFATFFMQSPSFLAQQTALARGRGTSNCPTLFQMARIPTDNRIRALLDPVPPQRLFPMFPRNLAALVAGGGLAPFQRLGGHVLIALDGTEYFCSQKLSCPNGSSCPARLRHDAPAPTARASISSRRRTAQKSRIARPAPYPAGLQPTGRSMPI